MNERVLAALALYLKENREYPCPAVSTLGRGDPALGVANCGGVISSGGVFIGDVPVKDLNLPPRSAANSAGWKYTYAVTQALTDTATFNNIGAITVQDDSGGPFLTQPAHFVVVNPGPDGKGARSLQGTLSPNGCGGSAALDAENCDNDVTFVEADFAMRSDVNNANYYDDSLSYALAREESTFWQTEEGTAGLDIVNRTPGNIGIGTAAPAEKLHVFGGDVRIVGTNGNLRTTQDILAEEKVEAANDIIVYTSTGRALAPIYYYAPGATPPPTCPSTGVTWLTNCSGSTSSTPSAGTDTVYDTTGTYVGQATYTCDGGTWIGPTAPSCDASAVGCTDTSVSWLTDCGGSTGSASDGATVTVSNTNAGYSGSADYTCSSGSWSGPSGATCSASSAYTWWDCTTSDTWSDSGTSCSSGPDSYCSGPAIANHGDQSCCDQQPAVACTDPNPYNTYECSMGNLSWFVVSTNSCSTEDGYCDGSLLPVDGTQSCCGSLPPSATCPGTVSVSYDEYTCQSGSWNSTSTGACDSATSNNSLCTSGGPVTSGTICCDSTPAPATCTSSTPDCTDQTVTWGSGCSGTTGTASDGVTATVSNNAGSYDGAADYTCDASTDTWSGPTNSTCDPLPQCGSASSSCAVGSAQNSSFSMETCGTMIVTDDFSKWDWECASGSNTVNCSCATSSPSSSSCGWGYPVCDGSSCTPVNGSCGSADGGSYSSEPSSGLCSSGTASSVTDNGATWDWTCNGNSCGSDDNCSATKTSSYAQYTCSSGSWSGPGLTCAGPNDSLCTSGSTTSGTACCDSTPSASTCKICPSQNVGWVDLGPGGCSDCTATLPASDPGTVTAVDLGDNRIGTAEYTCNTDGSWSGPSNESCPCDW